MLASEINRMSKSLMASALVACVLLASAGCGGGADDPTSVALKPAETAVPEQAGDGSTTPGQPATSGGEPATGGFGTIKGKIVISDGALPTVGPLIAVGTATVNPEFCGKMTAIPNEALIINPENRGLANVFVWLSDAPDGGKPEAAHTVGWPSADPAAAQPVFDQQNCTFVPHAMICRTGKPVMVKSQDPVPHNVHTYPKANETFNTVIDPTNKEGKALTYASQELVPIRVSCDFHKWMEAYHLPIGHPYAAVSNTNGEFTIADLPAGEHEFRIWHEGKMLSRGYAVTVEGGKETPVEIRFSLPQVQAHRFVPNLRQLVADGSR